MNYDEFIDQVYDAVDGFALLVDEPREVDIRNFKQGVSDLLDDYLADLYADHGIET